MCIGCAVEVCMFLNGRNSALHSAKTGEIISGLPKSPPNPFLVSVGWIPLSSLSVDLTSCDRREVVLLVLEDHGLLLVGTTSVKL